MFIDTHSHLYADAFDNDRDEMIERAMQEKITKFYLPAIDSGTHDAMLALENKYPNVCIPMMGVHPCSVKEDYKSELQIAAGWLGKRKFAAVGEIGLDFYWDKTFAAEQQDAFIQQIEMALQFNVPIVIHTRNAMQQTVAIVKQYIKKGLTGIFHCFSGSYEEANEIIKLGFYVGIGGVLTYKNASLGAVLQKIDMQHIVLETDAPYLTPMPYRGKRNESSYVKYVAEKLAGIKNISVEEVAAITSANAEKIFAC
jgi:TatD DNase family protein